MQPAPRPLGSPHESLHLARPAPALLQLMDHGALPCSWAPCQSGSPREAHQVLHLIHSASYVIQRPWPPVLLLGALRALSAGGDGHADVQHLIRWGLLSTLRRIAGGLHTTGR